MLTFLYSGQQEQVVKVEEQQVSLQFLPRGSTVCSLVRPEVIQHLPLREERRRRGLAPIPSSRQALHLPHKTCRPPKHLVRPPPLPSPKGWIWKCCVRCGVLSHRTMQCHKEILTFNPAGRLRLVTIGGPHRDRQFNSGFRSGLTAASLRQRVEELKKQLTESKLKAEEAVSQLEETNIQTKRQLVVGLQNPSHDLQDVTQ